MMFEDVTTIPKLIEISHSMAVDRGWWPNGPEGRSVSEQVNNFHAEISEAWEEYRHGRMELWWQWHGHNTWKTTELPQDAFVGQNAAKPEGFWVEIADLIIRLCDTAGAYMWSLPQNAAVSTTNIPYLIAHLSQRVTAMLWLDQLEGSWSCETAETSSAEQTEGFVLASCFASAEWCGVELWPLIRLKLAYNATREHRHGGLKA